VNVESPVQKMQTVSNCLKKWSSWTCCFQQWHLCWLLWLSIFSIDC